MKNAVKMSNTLNISHRISALRKEKNWSQGELAQKIEASREIIGKYERGENMPSIEMLSKMSKAFGVTVDFLMGESENASFDKKVVDRINDIQKMDVETQNILFNVIDTYVQNYKTKLAFA
jgi:transcriptional regulator with XRE-family HTH domain